MTKITGSGSRIRIQDPDPDPLVRGMNPRIRIHPKMSWICNTAPHTPPLNLLSFSFFICVLKGLSHEMDLAFGDIYGLF
jgi:hypothetical protein